MSHRHAHRTLAAITATRIHTVEKGASGPLRRSWRLRMSTAPETTKPKANLAALAVVVFGRDEAGKPHAAWFDQGEASLAEKAADLMGLRLLRVHTDEHRALAAQLPHGRVFASGRAFVPFVKASLFRALQAATQATSNSKPLKLVTTA